MHVILGIENLIVVKDRHDLCLNGTYILMEEIDINQMISV